MWYQNVLSAAVLAALTAPAAWAKPPAFDAAGYCFFPRAGAKFDAGFPAPRGQRIARCFEIALPPPGEHPEQDGAWLGVQLTPVPRALAAHLGTGESGLMVRNVSKESPADTAGIERYDVIIEADGKRIPGDVAGFAEHVRARKPGDEVNLLLYRNGKQMSLAVKVAEAPRRRLELKYPEESPDVFMRRGFDVRGKILRPGPAGRWIWEDLEDMPGLRDMIRERMREGKDRLHDGQNRLRERLRQFQGPTTRPFDDDVALRVEPGGGMLQVRRLPGGTVIEVRRCNRDRSGRAEIKTYTSLEALEQADPEAAELLKTLPPRDERGPAPLGRGIDAAPRGPRPVAPPAPPSKAPQPRPAAPPAPQPEVRPPAPPAMSFSVDPDGRITVHSRKGDAELNTTFESREQLKSRAPHLYRQFEDLEGTLR